MQAENRHLLDGLPPEVVLDDVEYVSKWKLLGKGSYGAVYLGKWNGSFVAIKKHWTDMIREENGEGLSVEYRRFLQEFLLLRDFSHPNLVQVYGMVRPSDRNDSPGLAMECLPIDLRTRYAKKPHLTILEQLDIAMGVASGLLYLHRRDVVHRDLTTSNILLTTVEGPDGTKIVPKIGDVGCAWQMEPNVSAQSLSTSPGNVRYMAPETRQASSRGSARYGRPVDCYAFGVTILAMTIRKEPPHVWELAARGREGDLAMMKFDNPFLGVVTACIEDCPGSRPTAADLCRQLGAIKEHTLFCVHFGHRNPSNPAESCHEIDGRAQISALQDEVDSAKRHAEEEQRRMGEDYKRVLSEKERLQGEVAEYRNENKQLQTRVRGLHAELETFGTPRKRRRLATTLRHESIGEQPERDKHRGAASRSQPDGCEEEKASHPECQPDTVSSDRPLVVRDRKRPPYKELPTTARWTVFGHVPDGTKFMCPQPCVHNGYFYAAFTQGSRLNDAVLYRTSLDDDDGMSWEQVPLPEGRWDIFCNIFSYSGDLFIAVIPIGRKGVYTIFRKRDHSCSWSEFFTLPERKFRFSLAVVRKELIVFGGWEDMFGEASRTTFTLHLDRRELSWVRLENFPFPCDRPRFTILNNTLHVLSYRGNCNDSQDWTKVVTMELTDKDRDRKWVLNDVPAAPSPECAVASISGHLFLGGGIDDSNRPLATTHVLGGKDKSWKPFSALCYPRAFGHCLAVSQTKLLCVGGIHNGLPCQVMEVLSI